MRSWAIAVAIAFSSASAFAQTGAGAYSTNERDGVFSSPFNAASSTVLPAEHLTAPNSYGGAYGYDFGNGFKTEIEGVTSTAVSDRFAGLAASGTLTNRRVMLRGMYDSSDGAWHLKPYIGAGFGVTDVNAHVLGVMNHDWVGDYQLRGGVTLGFTQKLVGSLEYRWTNGSKPSFMLGGVPTKLDVDRHGFTLGFDYKY